MCIVYQCILHCHVPQLYIFVQNVIMNVQHAERDV